MIPRRATAEIWQRRRPEPENSELLQRLFCELRWDADGSLILLRGKFSPSDYEAIRAAFVAKWGKPALVTTLPVQNMYGATFQVPIAVWKFAEGEMTLMGSATREDGSFEFETTARKAKLKALKQPKVDF